MYDLTSQRVLAGAAGAGAKLYVEDVFSTWLYTGNGSTQTITNGIDLSGKGGLVWIKARSGVQGTASHRLYDTARGSLKELYSDLTAGQYSQANSLTSFNSSGFSLGSDGSTNDSSTNFASWTFRKAAKFFDVVTFTQPGAASGLLTVSHSLGSTPGCIIVKRTSSTSNWPTYHRSIPSDTVNLNLTSAASVGFAVCQNVSSTSFDFNLTDFGGASGSTYVAYLFAHDAGGFGDSGNDSVVKCGSFTGGTFVDLGWEPQWILMKTTGVADGWRMFDNMRGLTASGTNEAMLQANSSSAESATGDQVDIAPTGFTPNSGIWGSFAGIYIAIRRGPMKTPTDATKVFSAVARTGDTSGYSTGFAIDMIWDFLRSGDAFNTAFINRLVGINFLSTSSTAAEQTGSNFPFSRNDGATAISLFGGAASVGLLNFRRAPGFFDVVAYTGTGSARTVSHNLNVAPELMIVKGRNNANNWIVYSSSLGSDYRLFLDSTSAAVAFSSAFWNSTNPTASVFSLGTNTSVNSSSGTFIAYLFATCPGVSKVGSYTGTGTTQQINCGFTAGARFVMIKRTDSTGDWYVWDSARGIVAGNDPYLLLNSTAAEVTSTDYVDTFSSGFEISSTAPAAINVNGGSFIFLAVA